MADTQIRKLILVKHAKPLVVPGQPAERWALSEQGRASCAPLAERLRALEPARIVASVEPKAEETGRLVADVLQLPFETAAGLHEHDRSNVPHLASGEFISMIELLFRRPADEVLGRETGHEAAARFEAAVDAVLAKYPAGNVAIVSHGTVIALYAGARGAGKAFELWRRMGLPSLVVISLPEGTVDQVVERL